MRSENSYDRHPPMMQAERFYALGRACVACSTEEEFEALVRDWVRQVLPHGMLVAVIGRVDLEHLEIRSFVGVDYPEAALKRLPMTLNLRERPVVRHWLQTRQPLVLQLPDDADLMSDRERFEIDTFGLGRLAIHGVVDLTAKTGSYFSFGQVPMCANRQELLATLRLIIPLLHQALMAIHQAQHSHARSPLFTLTPAERELMAWVTAGRTNSEIAQLRERSVATVRNQMHSAFVKLGAANRTEAVRAFSREE